MGSFTKSRKNIVGEQTSRFAAPVATGGGFDGAAKVQARIQKINGEIITTILVDLQGLVVSGTAKDIIGESGVAAAYITQITTAKNGIIYKAEMGCIEAPAGSNTTADITYILLTALAPILVEHTPLASLLLSYMAPHSHDK